MATATEITLDSLIDTASTAYYRSLLRKFKEAGHDITVEQWTVMLHLSQQEGLAQQEISGCSNKDNPSVCRLIDNLEKRELVLRMPDVSDRRINRIYLTTKGKSLQTQLINISQNNLKESTKNISTADLKTCKTVLEKIIENLTT